MEKSPFLLLIALFFQFNVFAEKVPGYIVTRSNDTIQVTFKIPFYYKSESPVFKRVQFDVKYWDSDKKKHVLKPKQAKEISFVAGGKKFRMISLHNNVSLGGYGLRDSSFVFLHLVVDGKVKLYKYYEIRSTPISSYPTARGTVYYGGNTYMLQYYILQKGNSPLFKPRSFDERIKKFKEDVAIFLNDCPQVKKNMEDPAYLNFDVEKVIEEYNTTCP